MGIIFYVHRTGLLNYYINPICAFLKNKYRITILNLDKRNGYKSQGNGDYDLIDISDYSIGKIQDLLKGLKPQAVILLGYISIYEFLMLRLSIDLHIKTIYLEHGIYSKETSSLPLGKLVYRFSSTVKKNLFFLRQYKTFISLSRNPELEKSLFKQCVLKKDYRGSHFSKALFFSDYGYQQLNQFWGYSSDEVDYVCYPLAKDNEEFSEYKAIASEPLSEKGQAILIHQPFILDGLVQWSYDEEKEYYMSIAKSLEEFGYRMTILVHPREDINRYKVLYEGTSVSIEQNINRKSYKDYSLAIGHYSTALLYPIFFNIPIMIVGYSKIKAETSAFYPLNCTLPIKDFGLLTQKYKQFCREYIGSSNCSFENIATVIDRNIQQLL